MNKDESWFQDWYFNQATDEERRLLEKVEDFGELFEDMLFGPGTCSSNLIKCHSKLMGTDEWVEDQAPRPDELEYFSFTFFKYKVESLADCSGFFNSKELLLCIDRNSLEDDTVILHEMIHLHEFVINDLPMYFHDMLYWALYQDLRKKIPRLDEIIDGHAHILTGTSIYSKGGLHDILFLLKSFDLDIRMGYSLGTVFGYGKEKEFEAYDYIKMPE